MSYCRQNAHNRSGMRICEIEVSRWSSGDYDLAGLKLKNAGGDNSEIIGRTLHTWETIELHNQPIERIKILGKSGSNDYMRGLQIYYRNGTSQNINTDQGNECATINFEPGDVFIGMTCILSAPDNKKPRRMGITILR